MPLLRAIYWAIQMELQIMIEVAPLQPKMMWIRNSQERLYQKAASTAVMKIESRFIPPMQKWTVL